MRFERLDLSVSVLRWDPEQSQSGEMQDGWTVLLDREPATRREARGEERMAVAGVIASQVVEFWLRWHAVSATITPKDRIVYPALAEEGPPEVLYDPDQYDILDVVEVDRRRYVKITAKRRVDNRRSPTP